MQDNYEQLSHLCKEEVQKLTRMEAEDAGELENKMIRACEKMLQKYCSVSLNLLLSSFYS